jgi:putative iron-regulated protein
MNLRIILNIIYKGAMDTRKLKTMGLLSLVAVACGGKGDARRDAVKAYATAASAMYTDSVRTAKILHTDVEAFVVAPSAQTLDKARASWKSARTVYGQTEALRFYGGPIDSGEGGAPESQINPWPLDENFIDAVEGAPNAGMINDASMPLTKELLVSNNGATGEKNLTLGWHAIEFLLWGQDVSATGPGDRPYTDFLKTGGTLQNQERRAQYLTLATSILIDDLESVAKQWNLADPDSYGAKMVAGNSDEALTFILKGIGNLMAGELTRERMNNPYATKDQEEEHSCFSDTTLPIDLPTSLQGVKVLLSGQYGGQNPPSSVIEVLLQKDSALAGELLRDLDAAVEAMNAIPTPFDQAILGAEDAPGRKAVLASMNANKKVALTLSKAAEALGLKLDFDYCPEGVSSCRP